MLSLILATRDRPDFIRRAVESVLTQDDARWELVVYDNGEPIRELLPDDPRIRYFHGTATGPADAFQQALDRALGDVVMPLADDDRLAPHAVRTVIDGIGDAQWGYAQTAFQVDGQTRFLLGAPWSLPKMREDYYLGGAVFWRRSLSERLGGFDSSYDHAADYDLYLRFGEDSDPVYIPEVLYLYNDHPQADSHVAGEAQRAAAQAVRNRRPRRTVGVVTPWIAHPELMPAYVAALERADQVVIVENAGPIGHVRRDGWTVLHPGHPLGFAESNNAGAEIIRDNIDVIVFLNNDVHGDPSWIDRVRDDVEDGALYGPAIGKQTLRGVPIPYVEGWCVAATRETWEALGGWDAERFPLPYWEDVDLSLRAVRAGFHLKRAPWPIHHLGGVSTSTTPGAWDGFDAQRAVIESDLDLLLA